MRSKIISMLLALFCSVGTKAVVGPDMLQPANDTIESERAIDVAYGKRVQEMLTGSISVLHSDRISSSPEIGIDRIMKGRLTGLTVLSSGDEPGYSSSDFYIRGTGTYGAGKSPLIMIDGIEGSYAQIHPEEVASVTVLKDAAALALYGIRAANGVILIKTKRGYEGKTMVSIKVQSAMMTPTLLPEYLSSKEFLHYRNVAVKNDGLVVPTDPRLDPRMYGGTNDPYLYPNTNWYDEMLNKFALQQNYSASISGGSERVKYYVLAGVVSQNGLYRDSDKLSYTGINLRSNLDINVFKNFTINMDLSGRVEERKMPLSNAGTIFSALSTFPSYFPKTNRDGSLAGSAEYNNNPLGLISKTGYGNQNSRYLTGNIRANYDFSQYLQGLNLYAQYSFNTYKHFGRQKSQSFALYRENLDGAYSVYGQDKDLSLQYGQMNDAYALYMLFAGGLEYHKIKGDRRLDASLNLQLSSKEFTGNNPNNKQLNYFGHIAYGYDKCYVVEVGASYSGSEDFIDENRFGFFPSISGAWNVSNEDFMSQVKWVDHLKLRASYGLLGNSNIGIGRFPSDPRYYKGAGYYFGGSTSESDGAYEGSISNPNITFETSYNGNAGIDFEMFNHTLYGSIDAFYQKRKNIITQRTATKPALIGQVLPFENYGEVSNKGVEIMLGYRNSVGSFNYYVEANLSFARSTVDLYDEISNLNSWESRVGKSVSQLWGHEVLGIFQSEEEVHNWARSIYGNVYPGDFKYANLNNDKLIDDSDEKPIGNPTVPELTGGLLLGLKYKGLDLSLLLNAAANRSVLVNNNVFWGVSNMTETVYDTWQKGVNEASALYPRSTTLTNNHNYRLNSMWVMGANYLKIQNVELGYTIPKSLMNKIKINELRIFVNAANLGSFDNLKQYGLNVENPDIGIKTYPQMAVYNIGLSLLF